MALDSLAAMWRAFFAPLDVLFISFYIGSLVRRDLKHLCSWQAQLEAWASC